MDTLTALYERQGRVATLMRGLVDKAVAEDRGLTADEQSQWDKASEDEARLSNQIQMAEKLHGIDEQALNAVRKYNDEHGDHALRGNPGERESEPESKISKAVRNYYRFDKEIRGMPLRAEPGAADSDEYISAFRSVIRGGEPGRELRAAQTSTTTGGGYVIPTGFRVDIEVAMLQFGGLRKVATILPTETGNPLPWPTVNDTAVTGRLLAENAGETNTAVTFGQITFNGYKYSSDYVLVPIELAQDSAVNLEALLARLLGERLGRVTAVDYVTGSGSSRPNGIVTASVQGAVTGGAAASNLDYNDILSLVHSVDPAYRVGPKVGFLMADATLLLLKKLQDAVSGRPLWQPAIANEVPPTLDGYRYYIDQAVPAHLSASPTSASKVVLFGDLGKYMIRDVMDITLTVLRELYAGNHQIGYVAVLRTDGDLLDAGTRPVKYLQATA